MLLRLFHRIKNARLANEARDYTAVHYRPERPAPDLRFSRPRKNESDIKFSPSGGFFYDDNPKPNIKHSFDDTFDEAAAATAVRSVMTGGDAEKAAAALESSTKTGFVDKLLQLITEKKRKDSSVYKAAGIDRRLFSKIVSDKTYKPAKDTCIAFALALHLTVDEASDLLARAGYTLSHSTKRDVVIEFCFKEGVYALADVNEILFKLDMKMIGK